jgi:GDP-4-dehydro-6-deoxy-D-mannose reductase
MGEEERGELSEIMRALITGITGFVGSHLAEYLLSEGVEVFGTYTIYDDLRKIEEIKDKIILINWFPGRASLEHLAKSNPDYIFSTSDFNFNLKRTHEGNMFVNLTDIWVILSYSLKLNIQSTILLAGSGEEYGCPPLVDYDESDEHGFPAGYQDWTGSEINRTRRVNYTPKKVFKLPITEDFALNPMSIYGVAKAAQDMLGYAYHKEHGMKIVRTRAFDISGPGDESSVASDIARQIVEVEQGRSSEVRVGSCDIKKDFTDIRDLVKAYWLAVKRGKPGEAYNICSGKSRSIQNVIDTLRMQSTAEFDLVEDKTMMKVTDIPVLEGDHSKFTKLTGWKPGIGFAQTMGDLLDYWRGTEEHDRFDAT